MNFFNELSESPSHPGLPKPLYKSTTGLDHACSLGAGSRCRVLLSQQANAVNFTALERFCYWTTVNTTGALPTNPRWFEVAKTHMNGTYKVLTSISVVLPVTSTADVTVSSFCMNFHMLLRPDSNWGTHRPTHSQLFGVCHLDIPRGVSGAKNRMSVVVLPVSECHSLAPRCAS